MLRRCGGASARIGEKAPRLLSGTPVGISRCVGDELLLLALAWSMPHLRQWHVGLDARVLDARDVRDCAVLGISSDLARSQLPAEACLPEQVKGRRVLLYLCGGDQGGEDDPRPTPVNDRVVLIAQVGARVSPRHRRGIGGGGADAEGGRPP